MGERGDGEPAGDFGVNAHPIGENHPVAGLSEGCGHVRLWGGSS